MPRWRAAHQSNLGSGGSHHRKSQIGPQPPVVAGLVSTSREPGLLRAALLGPDLLYERAEVFPQEVLVRIPKLQRAALCLRSETMTCSAVRQGQPFTNAITMSLSLIILPVSCPESARSINAGSRMSTWVSVCTAQRNAPSCCPRNKWFYVVPASKDSSSYHQRFAGGAQPGGAILGVMAVTVTATAGRGCLLRRQIRSVHGRRRLCLQLGVVGA